MYMWHQPIVLWCIHWNLWPADIRWTLSPSLSPMWCSYCSGLIATPLAFNIALMFKSIPRLCSCCTCDATLHARLAKDIYRYRSLHTLQKLIFLKRITVVLYYRFTAFCWDFRSFLPNSTSSIFFSTTSMSVLILSNDISCSVSSA